jgi:hypothetical protein
MVTMCLKCSLKGELWLMIMCRVVRLMEAILFAFMVRGAVPAPAFAGAGSFAGMTRYQREKGVRVRVRVWPMKLISVRIMMVKRPHTHTLTLPLLFPLPQDIVIPAQAGTAPLTTNAKGIASINRTALYMIINHNSPFREYAGY